MSKATVPAKKPRLLGSATKRTASTPMKSPLMNSGSSSAGAVNEESFIRAFEDVSPPSTFSTRQIANGIKAIRETIGDPSKDWNKRVDLLKKLRALIMVGATNYEDFYGQLRMLEIPLQATLKDPRSQVVREACITIAFMAQTLGIKFDHCAECLFNTLINLTQNSAKVMATAGRITVKFILQCTQSPKLIPIIGTNLTSKSHDIRRSCSEFLEQILSQWPMCNLERHVLVLQNALKKGVADADAEVRVSSRKAFRSFKEHFPNHAEALLASLEPNYRRALQGEPPSSSSINSLTQTNTLQMPRQHRFPTTSQNATGFKLDGDHKDTTSQDCSISQVSPGNIRNDVAALEERSEELTVRPNYTPRSLLYSVNDNETNVKGSGSSKSLLNSKQLTARPSYTPYSLLYCINGIETNTNDCETNGYNSEKLVKRILEQCAIDSATVQSEKQSLLSQLVIVINCGDIEPVIANFKRLLRIFLNHLRESDAALQIAVLQIFMAICKDQDMRMKEWRDQFLDLLIVCVLDVNTSGKRDVVKMAEKAAAAMCVFPFEDTLKVLLRELIETREYAILQGALKMLTTLIEMHPGEVTDNDLADFMPELIKANDHIRISVRKSAVLCMVEVHKAVGEERMAPYIASLSGSQLKLLRLYIVRAKESPIQNS